MWPPNPLPGVPFWALWSGFPGRGIWGPDLHSYRTCRDLAELAKNPEEQAIMEAFTAYLVSLKLTDAS